MALIPGTNNWKDTENTRLKKECPAWLAPRSVRCFTDQTTVLAERTNIS